MRAPLFGRPARTHYVVLGAFALSILLGLGPWLNTGSFVQEHRYTGWRPGHKEHPAFVPVPVDEDFPSLHTPTPAASSSPEPCTTSCAPSAASASHHPIDKLVEDADHEEQRVLSKQTKGIAEAAAAYRERRGRHPPPLFDRYVRFCEERDVLMIEDFYDPMYRDLTPFWGVSPDLMRRFPRHWGYVLSIRNGTTYRWNDEFRTMIDWMSSWERGIRMLPLEDLPDIDLAFNGEDEPKLFVPWETIDAAVTRGESERKSAAPPAILKKDYQTLPSMPFRRPAENRSTFEWSDIEFEAPLWRLGREACAPDTMARHSPAEEDLKRPPEWPDPAEQGHMYQGFVSNWTRAKSTCENPHLRSLHGSWTGMNCRTPAEPQLADTKSVTQSLVPLLAGCKINAATAEILVPPAVQWPSLEPNGAYSYAFDKTAQVPWESQADAVLWRGTASGGINDEQNWTRFQRHRLVAMTNGTLVGMQESVRNQAAPAHAPGEEPDLPYNFPLPSRSTYNMSYHEAAEPAAAISKWINAWADTAFTHLQCWPPLAQFFTKGQDCGYNGRFYHISDGVPSEKQFEYKYIPDMDGMSFSGRFRSLLQSNSVPIKGTIYDTWDDARLIPWRHFVPMDNTFMDWYAIMEYFLGYEPERVEGCPDAGRSRAGHDGTGRRLASQGAEWSAKVLRTEDQLAWMYRLILELARLNDDRRLEMGYDDDLRKE